MASRKIRTDCKPRPLVCLAGLTFLSATAFAMACEVPSQYPTIQDAVDDPQCADITLRNRTFAESIEIPRSLTIAGVPGGTAVIQGNVSVEGAAVMVALSDFSIESGCAVPGLSTSQGAQTIAYAVDVQSSSAFACGPSDTLFSSGFE